MRSPRRPAAARMVLAELAERLGAELLGDGGVSISGAGGLEDAVPGDLVRVDTPRFLPAALTSPAAALLIGPDMDPGTRPALRVPEPRVAFARALEILYPAPRPAPGIDPAARIGPDAHLGEGCSIGPYVVIGARVSLGAGVILHPFVSLGDDVEIGEGSILFPSVTLYDRVILGQRVRVHSGTVIGADGFGYVPDQGSVRKVPQVGTVVIENDVEIGANVGIDRATTGETRIGAGTKIDNLVQIGHNVRIGRSCLIAGHVGIAGSCTIEDGVIIGGQVGLKDHVRVGRGAVIAGQSAVWGDVPEGALVSGTPARPHRETLRRHAEAGRSAETVRRMRELERRLAEVEARLFPK